MSQAERGQQRGVPPHTVLPTRLARGGAEIRPALGSTEEERPAPAWWRRGSEGLLALSAAGTATHWARWDASSALGVPHSRPELGSGRCRWEWEGTGPPTELTK